MPAKPALAGLRVVDLTRHLPGPLMARLLADLGARVIKVEEPRRGDPVREAPPLRDGRSALATLLLAGIESVALDLKREPAVRALRELVSEADVLLESFRPGTLARLGLDPEELRRRHPRLVICSLSGWGQLGPWAARAGHDLTYQAIAGALAPTGGLPNVPVADLVGAWSGVAAVLAALHARHDTGAGAWIDQALVDAAAHANLVGWAAEAAGPRAVGEPHGLTGALPCYRVYPTRDRRLLAVACLEPHFWRRLCRAGGRRDLEKAQYDRSSRGHRRVADFVASRSLAEWQELLAGEDLPVAPVLSPAEAAAHEQVAQRGVARQGADGAWRLGYPALLDGARPRAGGEPPELGAHTAAVIAEHGLPFTGHSPRRLRALGIGRRRSLRAWLRRWILERR
ncbi:MAG TPA: CaiB/BaiF CoA-transferase family protein [Thermoanaerobaculia bacterium]|nr:CaiB/BaiF CoA-transferase family protein [Thermoanaerobaculia bacterium]